MTDTEKIRNNFFKWWNAYFNKPRAYWTVFGTMPIVLKYFSRAYRQMVKDGIEARLDSVTRSGIDYIDAYMLNEARRISQGGEI